VLPFCDSNINPRYGTSEILAPLLFLDKFKVFTTPGVFFGKEWDDHIRISLSCNEILFKKAIDRLIKFSDNYEKN
jgi:aspartate/methionine/tyrosine aminotransferase